MRSTPASLTRYHAERDQWLQRLTEWIEQDSRIVAAWLFGSIGRGDDDSLSDIDLWLVIADDHIQDVVERRRAYVAAVQTPVLMVEAPQNAPEAGGYLMALYDAPVGPHQVDWYWQPRSQAVVPAETRVLFDRAGLPRVEQAIRLAQREGVPAALEQPAHSISFFWAMLLIAAKYIARGPGEAELPLLPHLLDAVRQTQLYVGWGDTWPAPSELASPLAPQAKVKRLRDWADHMQALMKAATATGAQVPDGIVPGAYRYLDLIAEIIGE